MMDKVPREITQSINARVIVLALCTSLMLIEICIKFPKDSLNSFQVIVRTCLRLDFVIDKILRVITQTV